MKDKYNNDINIGDIVAYAPGGSYKGISIGAVEKFTEKKIGIRNIEGGEGRYIYKPKDRLYYADGCDILIYNRASYK